MANLLRIAVRVSVFGIGGLAMAQTYFPTLQAQGMVPAGNPITTPKALLGMALFWEEQLSSANTTACGSCHVFSSGGVDPRSLANTHPGRDGILGTADDIHGARGVPLRDATGHYANSTAFGVGAQVTDRKAPSVINAAYQPTLFYDGRAQQGNFLDPVTNQLVLTGPVALENLVSRPPVNSVEMAHNGRTWTEIADKIARARPLALASNIPARLTAFLGTAATYRPLFAAAYGDEQVTPSRIILAIATYLRTLISDQAPYDRYLAGAGTLTAEEQRGLAQFQQASGSAAACARCHGDVTAGSHQFGPGPRTTMYGNLPVPNSHNTGIRPIQDDPGVGGITNNQTDQGRFRAPGLRNTALHGIWFHNGQLTSLTQVVEFYNRGGDFHVNQAIEIQPRSLSATTIADIVAFLGTLTDPRVRNEQAPFDRPRLGSESANFAPVRFGTGTASSTGRIPEAVALEPIFAGNPGATIALKNTAPNVAAFVMWDTDAVQSGFTYAGLHFHLGFYNFSFVYGGQTQSSAVSGGFASLVFPVPANQALVGTRLYAQWLLADPAGPVGATTSDAIEIVVR